MLRRILLWNFHIIFRLSNWFRQNLTTAGKTTVAVMLAAGALGIDTRQNQLYQAFALLLAVLLVSFISARLFRGRFQVIRTLPQYVTCEETFVYHIQVTNQGNKDRHGLVISEKLESPPITGAAYAQYIPRGEQQRNWLDRKIGYPRWSWLMKKMRGASIDACDVDFLPTNTSRTIQVQATPVRRGYLTFSQTQVGLVDRLGLVRHFKHYPNTQRILSLPRRYPVKAIFLKGHRNYQPGGTSAAQQTGDSTEFVGVREYKPGDPLRHLHWKSWARTGTPIVKQFQDEYQVRNAIILDNCIAGHDWRLFEEGVSLAASYVAIGTAQDSLLDLLLAGNRGYPVTLGDGHATAAQLLSVLATIQSSGPEQFDELASSVERYSKRLSACICILMSWDDERQQLIQSLRSHGVDITVFVLQEEETALEAGPMSGIDSRLHPLPISRIAETLEQIQA